VLSPVLAAGTLIGGPLVTIVATPQTAHATVAAGDVVFVQTVPGDNPYTIEQRASGGTLTNLSTSTLGSDFTPDVSPDGSRIAFMGQRPFTDQPANQGAALVVMNSDGSGQTTLIPTTTSPYQKSWLPVWSPDGTQIAYVEDTGSATYIAVRNADGSGYTRLTTGGFETNPSWSPTKVSGHYRIAYESDTGSIGGQIYIVNDNGTGAHSVTGSDTLTNDMAPVWSPTGNRIYFIGGGFAYFGSSDGFATTSVTRTQLSTVGGAATGDPAGHYKFAISADGSTLTYAAADGSGCTQVFTISTSTATTSQLTSTGCSLQNYSPTFVPAAWPPAPPSNSTATFSAPSSSDAYGTRQVTVNLSATGMLRFDAGWSTSSTTAPNTSYLQTITNLTSKKGPINFLGKYASGTTWNGGTQPDQDWYLWVRSVQSGGTANAWATPLKVHTPKAPIWVAVGDSFSSGHHEASDQPLCPTQADAAVKYLGKTISCAGGASYLPSNDPTPNDASASWVNTAVASYNSSTHAPSAWQISLGATGADGMPVYLIARSGAPTSQFGRSDLATPGTPTWASGDTQSAKLSLALYARYDSWNVASMTGGADDTNWTDVLANWYLANWSTPSVKPWAVSSGIANCPDANSVYNNLTVPDPGTGLTVSGLVQSNLQGMETVAVAASPGVRVLNIGYPNVTDSTGNSCYADSGSTKGTHSVVVELNGDHTYVSGANVRYVDLTASTSLGTSPVTGGYISTYRIYGYPHPTLGSGSGTGQSKVAATAIAMLTGTSW
jgi:hypothetical protein